MTVPAGYLCAMSVHAIRRSAAVSLLVVMAYLCLPKGFLHQCDRGDAPHAHATSAIGADDHCPICDQMGAPMLAMGPMPALRSEAPVIARIDLAACSVPSAYHEGTCTRGPPALA